MNTIYRINVYLFFLFLQPMYSLGQVYIHDLENIKTFELKAGIKIEYVLKGSDSLIQDKVIKIESDTLNLRKSIIRIDSLAELSFRPKKLRNTILHTGLIIYGIAGITTLYIDANTRPYPGGAPLIFMYLGTIPFVIPGLWLTSEIMDRMFVSKKRFVFDKPTCTISTTK